MQALQLHLQREAEVNPQASYYNVGIIKYQVRLDPLKSLILNPSSVVKRALPPPPAVLPGPGPGPAAALGRVSAQRYGHARVPGLPLLPRHGALHPADHRPGAAAAGPRGHGPAVSAARLLVSARAFIPVFKNQPFSV